MVALQGFIVFSPQQFGEVWPAGLNTLVRCFGPQGGRSLAEEVLLRGFQQPGRQVGAPVSFGDREQSRVPVPGSIFGNDESGTDETDQGPSGVHCDVLGVPDSGVGAIEPPTEALLREDPARVYGVQESEGPADVMSFEATEGECHVPRVRMVRLWRILFSGCLPPGHRSCSSRRR